MITQQEINKIVAYKVLKFDRETYTTKPFSEESALYVTIDDHDFQLYHLHNGTFPKKQGGQVSNCEKYITFIVFGNNDIHSEDDRKKMIYHYPYGAYKLPQKIKVYTFLREDDKEKIQKIIDSIREQK